MWQYTTETIINSNVGNLVDGLRFGIYDADGSNSAAKSSADPKDFVLIDGVNAFKVKNITAIYKNPFKAEKMAKATLDCSGMTVAAGKVYRLTVVLREEGSARSTMQNAYLHKSKPFHFEVMADSAAVADLLAKMLKVLKADKAMSDFKYFKSAVSGTDLVLTGEDCYIQFKAVALEEVLPLEDANTPLAAKLLGANVVADAGVSVDIERADQGAGTVAHLIKDLRIPTAASINPFSADQGGKPVPGGHYDQYLVEYTTDRHHIAHGVMGSVAEKSLTSHVFFVKNDGAVANGTIATAAGASKDFEDMLNAVATANSLTIEDVSTKVVNGEFKDKTPEVGSVE